MQAQSTKSRYGFVRFLPLVLIWGAVPAPIYIWAILHFVLGIG